MSSEQDLSSPSSRLVSRLRVADHALNLLAQGDLPNVRKFVFNATFDVLAFASSGEFATAAGDEDPDIHELMKLAQKRARVRTVFGKEQIQFVLCHESGVNADESALYGRAMEAAARVTFAAVGLDMGGHIQPPDAETD